MEPDVFEVFHLHDPEKRSFRVDGVISVGSDFVKLPRIGKISLKEVGYLPVGGRFYQRQFLGGLGGGLFLSR